MGKISNFFIFFSTICILTIIVITATTIKISEHHEQKAIYAMETNIKVHAKRCYLENKCNGVITLDYLYKNNIIEEVVNPITKEIIDPSSTIEYVDGEIILNIK